MVLDPSETLLLPVPDWKKKSPYKKPVNIWSGFSDQMEREGDKAASSLALMEISLQTDSPLQRDNQQDIWEGAVVTWTESRFSDVKQCFDLLQSVSV